MIAALITQHRGEYVLRIGMQPSHIHLFAGNLNDASDGWSGIPRTEQDLDQFKEIITKTVEEVGGKASYHPFEQSDMHIEHCTDFRSVRDASWPPTDITTLEVTSTKCVSHSRGPVCGCWKCRQW